MLTYKLLINCCSVKGYCLLHTNSTEKGVSENSLQLDPIYMRWGRSQTSTNN